jgi:hypothetical protein
MPFCTNTNSVPGRSARRRVCSEPTAPSPWWSRKRHPARRDRRHVRSRARAPRKCARPPAVQYRSPCALRDWRRAPRRHSCPGGGELGGDVPAHRPRTEHADPHLPAILPLVYYRPRWIPQ